VAGSHDARKKRSLIHNYFMEVGGLLTAYGSSVPASSVASERVFSSAGTVICNRRSNLDPSQVERLVFLNHNLRNISMPEWQCYVTMRVRLALLNAHLYVHHFYRLFVY
jgi:hypothetical protein